MTRLRLRAALATASAGLMAVTALPAASAEPVADSTSAPAQTIVSEAERLLGEDWVDAQTKDMLSGVVSYLKGDSADADAVLELPETNQPVVDFLWPTVAQNCGKGTMPALGATAALPGPAALPLPGIPAGHAGFTFTALGSDKAAKNQNGYKINWVNVTNGRVGETTLKYTGVNPDGPVTLNGVANTGAGQVFALAQGVARNEYAPGRVADCAFFPTVSHFTVR